MKLVCPSCGARYEKGKFCPECGSPLSEVSTKKVLFCPSCQTEVPSGKFCPECGTKLEEREIEIGAESIAATPAVEPTTHMIEPSVDPEVEAILAKYRDEFGDMRELNKEEYAIAAEELKKCADKGNLDAICFLACLYTQGQGVMKDTGVAYNLICEAEKKGSNYASAILGVFYAHGIIVDVDYQEAIRRLVEGYDKTKIPAFAGFAANVFYVIEDYLHAFKYAQIAAEKADKEGFAILGLLYQNGLGVDKDDYKAFESYMQAAALGHEDALNQIGWMYQTGCGIEEDPAQAFFWYNESAQKGSAVGMNNLGCCYQLGIGVEQDVEVAAEWFKKAAEAGYVDSMLELGDYYRYTLFNIDKSKSWYLKAAEVGSTNAMNSLGEVYELESNYQEAIKWYEKATEQNQPNAFRNLALCYRDGNGVVKDIKKAEELLLKAAELGVENATELIAEIRKSQGPSAEILKIWYDCDGHKQINVHSHFVVHGLKGKRGCLNFEITGRKNKKYCLSKPVNFDYDNTEWKDSVFIIKDANYDLNLGHDETINCEITISVTYYTDEINQKILATSKIKVSIYYYLNIFSPSLLSITVVQ